jgi:hypothetical protein
LIKIASKPNSLFDRNLVYFQKERHKEYNLYVKEQMTKDAIDFMQKCIDPVSS